MAEEPDIFAKEALLRKRLRKQLLATPLVSIKGVVDAKGASGVKSKGDKLWRLQFTFAAWRILGEKLETTALKVHRDVTTRELDRLRRAIDPYRILRIVAHLAKESLAGGPQALLQTVAEYNSYDFELYHFTVELQKPVVYEDALFGTLTLDRTIDWYRGRVSWGDAPIDLSLDEGDSADPRQALETAYELWRNQTTWDHRIRAYMVADLLPLKNEWWLEENEPQLTSDDFLSKILLEALVVYPDKRFEFWYADGDLFLGHAIRVGGNLSDGPTDVDLSG
jgi:hypothetical protein